MIDEAAAMQTIKLYAEGREHVGKPTSVRANPTFVSDRDASP